MPVKRHLKTTDTTLEILQTDDAIRPGPDFLYYHDCQAGAEHEWVINSENTPDGWFHKLYICDRCMREFDQWIALPEIPF